MQDDMYRGMHIPKGTIVSFDGISCPDHCRNLDIIPGHCKHLVRQSLLSRILGKPDWDLW
jgi:hypothetical protein